MEEEFIHLDSVAFYEDDFELHPEEFKILLQDMHEEYDLIDVKPLLKFAEELEAYEICIIIKDFEKNVLGK
jgi:hypothetical protein